MFQSMANCNISLATYLKRSTFISFGDYYRNSLGHMHVFETYVKKKSIYRLKEHDLLVIKDNDFNLYPFV